MRIEAKGYKIGKEFADAAVSGATSAIERPQFKAMLGYPGEGDTFVVAAIDRLGRNAIDVFQTAQTLKSKGVSVVSRQESFDLTTPAGELMLTMHAGLAQLEKTIIAERREAGMARARADGLHMGRPRKAPVAAILELLVAHAGNVSATARARGISRLTVIRGRAARL